MAEVASVGTQQTIEQIIEAQQKKAKEARNTGELGKDDFLKLLITQVQNQDPMNPSSDTDFIAQMAQFSALEQMQNLNQSFSYSTGFSMMGKYITGEIKDADTDKVKLVTGRVDSVRVNAGKVYAVVGNDEVPVDKIAKVSDNDIGMSANVADYSNMIGLLGKTTIVNIDGKKTSVEGIISSYTKESKGVFARLDEVEIEPYGLDMGAFANKEEYVKGMIGKEITVKLKDSVTGAVFNITGKLRTGYDGKDGDLRLLLDDVKVPAGDIYSAKKVDLLSSEQLLLSKILEELQKKNGSGTENPDNPATTDQNTGVDSADVVQN